MGEHDTLPVPRSGVLDITAYVPGRTKAPDGVPLHKLSSNETPLGPSPAAREAFIQVSAKLADYPDGSATVLREAIAAAHGLNPANIVCGNGSDELLELLARAYLETGDEVIYSQHGFLVYRIATLAAGGIPVVAPEKDLTTDVDAMLSRITKRTRIVFLANPNNPTGTYLPIGEVRRLHAMMPKGVLLVLDAAYAEYVRRNDYEAGLELVSSAKNVVMTRTFSKIHGLAALRIGWCFCPPHVAGVLNRIRGPFNLNAAAIAAGAAAIGDLAHVEKAVAHNEHWLGWTTQQIRRLGFEVTASVGNFILIRFPRENGRTAADADEFLMQRGFVLRTVKAYGLPDCLRMTIGSEAANRGVVKSLSQFIGNPK